MSKSGVGGERYIYPVTVSTVARNRIPSHNPRWLEHVDLKRLSRLFGQPLASFVLEIVDFSRLLSGKRPLHFQVGAPVSPQDRETFTH